MLSKGFRFGMLLQIAIGPISIFIFQVAVSSGFLAALTASVAVTLTDGLFILAAIIGIGTLLEQNEKLKKFMMYGGGLVLLIFGINMILVAVGNMTDPVGAGSEVVQHREYIGDNALSLGLQAFALTAANPLTVLFWVGVFSAKMSEDAMTKRQMYFFGLGAVLSTLICMSVIAGVGAVLKVFVGSSVMAVMNLLVGLVLVRFSVKVIFRDRVPKPTEG